MMENSPDKSDRCRVGRKEGGRGEGPEVPEGQAGAATTGQPVARQSNRRDVLPCTITTYVRLIEDTTGFGNLYSPRVGRDRRLSLLGVRQ